MLKTLKLERWQELWEAKMALKRKSPLMSQLTIQENWMISKIYNVAVGLNKQGQNGWTIHSDFDNPQRQTWLWAYNNPLSQKDT